MQICNFKRLISSSFVSILLLSSKCFFFPTLQGKTLPSDYSQIKIGFFLIPHSDSTNDRKDKCAFLPARSPSAIWLFPLCETSRCPIFLSNPSLAFPISCLFLQRPALLTKWEKQIEIESEFLHLQQAFGLKLHACFGNSPSKFSLYVSSNKYIYQGHTLNYPTKFRAFVN